MRITGILCFVCVMHLSAALYSQTIQVNLKMKDATIEQVLNKISESTKMDFFYSNSKIDVLKRVSVNFSNVALEDALRDIFKGYDVKLEISDGFVVIHHVRPLTAADTLKKITVTGTVKDPQGTLLPGVTIQVKGTRMGFITNVDGKFKFDLPKRENLVLLFSFVGYQMQEVQVKNDKPLDIIMKDDMTEIDEVVVTGYQTVSRRDMVGSYSVLKMDDIMMPAYSSIDQMLQGQVPGMVVINTSSRVGTSPTIKIRGTSTVLGNQSPLWVVDGIIQEDPLELDAATLMTQDLKTIIGSQVAWLNPMDIETVTVLKDASATAVYGSKASNGVIVVTTKKGKADRLTVNYSGNLSINSKPNYGRFNYMNSRERVRFSQEAFNGGAFYQKDPIPQPYTYEGVMQQFLLGSITKKEFSQRQSYLETVNTDWFDLLCQVGISQSHNVSVSGGSERITYNVSAGYNNQQGQEIGNSMERLTGRVSVDVKLRDNIRLNASMNGTSSTTRAFGQGVNPMGYATTTSRAVPAFDENGNPVFYQQEAEYSYNKNITSLGYNFINERDNSGSKIMATNLSTSLNFDWSILEWLKYQFTGGYTRNHSNNESWSLEKTFRIAKEYRGYDYNSVEPGSAEFKAAILPFGGELYTTDAMRSSYNIQNKLVISKEFNADNRLNVMLGMELRSNAQKNNTNTVWGYVPERGDRIVTPPSPGQIVPITGSVPDNWGLLENWFSGRWKRLRKTDNFLSFFATMAYSWKDRYVFNFSIRNDASNRFGQDANKRFDPTYSFGVSWRVMEEPIFAGQEWWVSGLNLRATYGIQGNALTRVSPDLTLSQQGVANLYNQYYSTIVSIPNPNLSWERTHTFDLGTDFSLFNMFSLTFDYYWRRSNAIVSQDIAFEYGQQTMKLNGGLIRNSGVEFTVSFTPLKRKDWALSFSLNSSKNWNKAKSQQYEPKRGELLAGSSTTILKEGYPLSGFWSYSFAGLSPEDGRPLFNNLDVPAEQRSPKVDPTTFLVYSGESEPAFTGGLNFSLRYKAFSLSSGFSLLLGAKKRLPSPYASFPSGGVLVPGPLVNLNKDLNKRWKKAGDEERTCIPGFVTTLDNQLILPDKGNPKWMEMWAQSDVMVVDASFLRCRQISVSWNMHQAWCRKVGVKSLRLSGTVDNIFVIASKSFNGFDPELGNSVLPKNFSLGLNIGF